MTGVAGTIKVPKIPVGEALPPLEAPEPVGTFEVTFHDSDCTYRYDGPDVLDPGQSIRILVANDSAVLSTAIAWNEFGAFAVTVPVDPGTTRTGYLVATGDRYLLDCATATWGTELMTIEVG